MQNKELERAAWHLENKEIHHTTPYGGLHTTDYGVHRTTGKEYEDSVKSTSSMKR